MSGSGLARSLKDIVAGAKLFRVWLYMGWREINLRYRRSILGPIWMVGNMAATALSLSILMGAIFDQSIRDFLPYTMAGLLVWQLASLPLMEGPDLFVSQAGTINNNNFPYSLYAFRLIWKTLIVSAHSLLALLAIFVATGSPYWPTWQALPGLLVVVAFATALSPVIGLFAARFRDLRFMLPQIAQLMFFLTPIFWRVENVPENRAVIYEWNPLYYMVAVLRDPLVGRPVAMEVWLTAIGIAVGAALLFIAVFATFRRRLPFWI